MDSKKNIGGRPSKFDEPSRPITVTLPDRILRELDAIGPDRGQAIVQLVESAVQQAPTPPLVEVIPTGFEKGLIIVGPSEKLKNIPFLHLVEISPTRFLLALEPGNNFQTLELAVRDALEDTDTDTDQNHERPLLTELLAHIQRLRKTARVSMAEILFVRLA